MTAGKQAANARGAAAFADEQAERAPGEPMAETALQIGRAHV